MTEISVQKESRGWGMTSLVMGIASILMSWTFFIPIIGLIVGIVAKRREPHARTLANWGVGLNAAMLVVGVVLWIIWGGIILATLGVGVATSVA